MLKAFTIIATVSSAAFAAYLTSPLVIHQDNIAIHQDNTVAVKKFDALPCMPKRTSDVVRDSQQVHRLDLVACGYDQGWSAYY
jgi:hypothetical protein